MRPVFLLIIHLLAVAARLLKTGGVRSVIAENLLLRQQLIVLGRARNKAPNLKTSDRFILGELSGQSPAKFSQLAEQSLASMVGNCIVVAYFKHQLQRNYQFAMHRFILGELPLFISAHRRLMTAVIVKPSTTLVH